MAAVGQRALIRPTNEYHPLPSRVICRGILDLILNGLWCRSLCSHVITRWSEARRWENHFSDQSLSVITGMPNARDLYLLQLSSQALLGSGSHFDGPSIGWLLLVKVLHSGHRLVP